MQLTANPPLAQCDLNTILSLANDPKTICDRVEYNLDQCLALFHLATLEAEASSQTALAKAYFLIEKEDVSTEEAVKRVYKKITGDLFSNDTLEKIAKSIVNRSNI